MPLKKLNLTELDSTDKLIHAIEVKDRRFRLFQTLFMVGTFILLIVIISAQQRTLDGVRDQLTQAKQIASENTKQSKEQQDTILRRLDCMSVFFSQRDRTNLSIENIDKCTLNRDGDIQTFFTQEPGQDPETTRERQPSTEQPSSLTPSPVATQPQGSNPASEQIIDPRPPTTLDLPILEVPPICALQILCVR